MNDHPCEKCGYCPCCKRGGVGFQPYPWGWHGPYWYTTGPNTFVTGLTTAGPSTTPPAQYTGLSAQYQGILSS